MSASLQATLLIILCVEFIIGILGNSFMALVNIMDCTKRRNISVVDQILTALAISRIVFLLLMVIIFLVSGLYQELITNENTLRIIFSSWTLANHFSIWLATCLSIFYFLKIAYFSSSLLYYLKRRVKNVVLVTLLVSLLILFVNIIIINMHVSIWIHHCMSNTSYSSFTSNCIQLSKFVLLTNTIFTVIPFTMSLVTFILLICSLWRHLKNIQNNVKGSRDISITAHIKTLQMVVAFLLLYTTFFLALVFQSWNYKTQKTNSVNLFLEAAGLLFPSGHSCVLILRNSKLRGTFFSMMRFRSNDAEIVAC